MYRFKRFNRGVAIGLAAIIITCVYVYWDERSFQKDTDVIRGVIESYLKAGEKAAVYPEALQTMERPLTGEEKQQIINRSIKVISDYWQEEATGFRMSYYRNKAGMLSGIRNNMFNDIGAYNDSGWSYYRPDKAGYVSKASFTIKEAEPAKKVAPKCAMLTVQLVRTYHFQGEVHTFGPVGGFVWANGFNDEEVKNHAQQLYAMTLDSEVNFYLTLTDSGWKIFEMTGGDDNFFGTTRPVNT